MRVFSSLYKLSKHTRLNLTTENDNRGKRKSAWSPKAVTERAQTQQQPPKRITRKRDWESSYWANFFSALSHALPCWSSGADSAAMAATCPEGDNDDNALARETRMGQG